MKKGILIALLLIGAVVIGIVAWQEFKGAFPAVLPPSGDISGDIGRGDTPLSLPSDFDIKIFVDNVPGVRVIVGPDQLGNYWISQPKEGIVSELEVGEDGGVSQVIPVFQNLNAPHGLALDPQDPLMLYIAEENRIFRARLYTDAPLETIADLPGGGRHTSRTIAFGPDNRLYVSIGSSCDTCEEENPLRAKIISMTKDGENVQEFARGLRNAVFFDWDPVDGRMWATEMGRDFLGDNIPPDEVNVVTEGTHYGWPFCYGDRVRDGTFGAGRVPDNFCENTESAHIEIQAHSAPLGLAFVPEEGWPEDLALDLLVAYHGSWNRSEPTGYKIVRFELAQESRETIGRHDFVSGWLHENGDVLGRPVDLHIQPGGILFITDDKAGVVYKLTWQNPSI